MYSTYTQPSIVRFKPTHIHARVYRVGFATRFVFNIKSLRIHMQFKDAQYEKFRGSVVFVFLELTGIMCGKLDITWFFFVFFFFYILRNEKYPL